MPTVLNRRAVDFIERREDFRNANGSFRGESGPPVGYGRLEGPELSTLRESYDGTVYTVYSYATPIAVVLADGSAVIPNRSYTVTTSRHQGLTRMGLRNAPKIEA